MRRSSPKFPIVAHKTGMKPKSEFTFTINPVWPPVKGFIGFFLSFHQPGRI